MALSEQPSESLVVSRPKPVISRLGVFCWAHCSQLTRVFIPIITQAVNYYSRLDAKIFMGIITRMGRPPKPPDERKTASMKIPLAGDEKELIERAALADDAKPVTWARDLLLRAAKRRIK